jgi:hypothetical protein
MGTDRNGIWGRTRDSGFELGTRFLYRKSPAIAVACAALLGAISTLGVTSCCVHLSHRNLSLAILAAWCETFYAARLRLTSVR